MELANRMRKSRKVYGYIQAEIAYKCDISIQSSGQIEWEAGKSTFEAL